jgi:hypothetical protein
VSGTNYPGAKDDNTSLPNPGAGDSTANINPLLNHNYQHDTANDAIKALEVKLGTTASQPNGSNQLLYSTLGGTSVWGYPTLGGDLTGNYPNPVLAASGVTSGTYGTSTQIPIITVDGKGRITSISTVGVVGGGGGGGASVLTTKGDLSGYDSAPNRIPIGANGYILSADSSQPLGLNWAPPPNSAVWGGITGTLSSQTDLNAALAAKQNTIINSDSITQGSTNLFLTGAERTKLTNTSGTNTGDQTTITGNAGSATVLQTARTIAGVSFNGSANIALASTNLSDTASIATLTAAQTLTNKTLTSPLINSGTVGADPTINLGIASKQYVDTKTLGSNSIIVQETPTGTVNGTTTLFTTQLAKYVANSLEVFINGLQQTKTTDYTETSPSSGTFTFTVAPLTGDVVKVAYQFSTGASGNADTVDGIHASATPVANQLLALNSSAQVSSDATHVWSAIGNMSSTTITNAYQDIATATLPTTVIAHKYLIIASFTINGGGMSTANDFTVAIRKSSINQVAAIKTTLNGTSNYFWNESVNYNYTASTIGGDVIQFSVVCNASGTGAATNTASHYSIIDLGAV